MRSKPIHLALLLLVAASALALRSFAPEKTLYTDPQYRVHRLDLPAILSGYRTEEMQPPPEEINGGLLHRRLQHLDKDFELLVIRMSRYEHSPKGCALYAGNVILSERTRQNDDGLKLTEMVDQAVNGSDYARVCDFYWLNGRGSAPGNPLTNILQQRLGVLTGGDPSNTLIEVCAPVISPSDLKKTSVDLWDVVVALHPTLDNSVRQSMN